MASVAFKMVASERFGWNVEVPAAWRYSPATADWPPHTYPSAGAPYTDNIEPAGGGFPALDISAQELAADQTPDTFLAWLDDENVGHGYAVLEDGKIVVDGVTGRLQRQTLATENIWEVALFKDGWVYLIYWVGLESMRAEDEPVFSQVMNTFRFPRR